MDLGLLLLGLLLLRGAHGVGRSRRRLPGRIERFVRASGAVLCLVPGVALICFAGLHFWSTHRPQPSPTQRELFRGVRWQRLIRRTPRPLVIQVVTIDLRAPGIGFLVTPGEHVPGGELRARTTSQFVRESGVQLAINASAFAPWRSHSPWDYYPHPGDPVEVMGLAVSRGSLYSQPSPRFPAVCFSRDNRVWFDESLEGAFNACPGKGPLLREGEAVPWPIGEDAGDAPHPRTAVAVDRAGTRLILLVVDSRQPGYSEGMTRYELAALALEYGGWDALNLDGGGSTALAIAGPHGRTHLLNSPVEHYIPGRERVVANHLGIFALPIASP